MIFGTFFVNSRGDKGTEMPGLTNKNTVLGVSFLRHSKLRLWKLRDLFLEIMMMTTMSGSNILGGGHPIL